MPAQRDCDGAAGRGPGSGSARRGGAAGAWLGCRTPAGPPDLAVPGPRPRHGGRGRGAGGGDRGRRGATGQSNFSLVAVKVGVPEAMVLPLLSTIWKVLVPEPPSPAEF